jgi:hypothetical protein
LISIGAASSELGFYYRTGGEVEWSDAGDYANDEGLKVLLSESHSVLVSALIIIILAWFTQGILYKLVGNLVAGLGKRIASGTSPDSPGCPTRSLTLQKSPGFSEESFARKNMFSAIPRMSNR